MLEKEAIERAAKRTKPTAKRLKLDTAASKRDKCQTEKLKPAAKRQNKTKLMIAASAASDLDSSLSSKHRSTATRTTGRPKPASKRLPLPRKPVWLDASHQVGCPETEVGLPDDHPMTEPACDDVEPNDEEVNVGNDGATEDVHNDDHDHNSHSKAANEMIKTVHFYGKSKQLLKRKHCVPSRYTE